jgi:nucleotide-binding universal stress UspA family protein
MKTILVPIDFSAASELVVAEAVALARAIEARLVVLHIVQPPIIVDSEFGPQMSSEYSVAAAESAVKQLAQLQRQLQAKGVTAETKHSVGPPGPGILETAADVNADYIVLGSHGHGAFYDLIIGSTTGRVLKQAKCPVVVVPPGTGKSRGERRIGKAARKDT